MVLVVMSNGDFCGIFKFAGEGGCILYGVWGALPFPGAGLPVLPPLCLVLTGCTIALSLLKTGPCGAGAVHDYTLLV